MFYRIIIVDRHRGMYADMAYQIMSMLQNQGDQVELVEEGGVAQPNTDTTRHIFLGTQYRNTQVPGGSIVTNFDNSEVILQILSREIIETCEVWDYSRDNIAFIEKMFPSAVCRLIELGYSPMLDLGSGYDEEEKDIDILFMGSVLPKREKILSELTRRGAHVVRENFRYGQERADLIKRAKVCISIFNNHVTQCVSSSRFAPILCNNGFIVCEQCSDALHEAKWSQFMISVPYEDLVETALTWLAQPKMCKAVADSSYARFKGVAPIVHERKRF